MKNKRFFELAKRSSIHSNHPIHQMGAVLVKKNKVVSFGFNSSKTHCKSNTPFKSIHAEFSAILVAGLKDLSQHEIYIHRNRKDGSLGEAKPCIHCEHMLKSMGIKKVHYTVNNGYKTEIY